jgi:hypothetical protein
MDERREQPCRLARDNGNPVALTELLEFEQQRGGIPVNARQVRAICVFR